MSSSSKRKGNTSADFKRIKAKVGKKAKRQNDTDVSFQSASLHLGQSFQKDDESAKSGNVQFLLSSRGKSLYQLSSTASTHPAAAARSSSLKGILDIIKKYPPAALFPNLSTLIPLCVHSCVDEDEEVRNVGIEALSALLKKLQEKKIKPFGTLLVARVSSALHSLNASIRVNGVKMVSILSTTCPMLTSSFVDKILPPFVGLLSDQRTKKAIDDILQSLISVLRVNATSDAVDNDAQSSTRTSQRPDLLYISGGRSRNTILRAKRLPRVSPDGIESISHLSRLERPSLSSFNVEKMITNTNIQRTSQNNSLEIRLKSILLTKLRDCLIESISLENEPAMLSNKTRSLSTESQRCTNFPRVLLLLRSIRYLSKTDRSSNEDLGDDAITDFHKVTNQIISIMIDVFPLDQDPSTISSVRDNSGIINDTNAAIAITVLEMSQTTYIDSGKALDDNVKGWVKVICSYVLPRIEKLRDNKIALSSDLDMTCKLLRRLGIEPYFSNDLASFLSIIHDIFISHENPEVARSTASRRISMMMMELIDSTDYSLEDELAAPISSVFSRFVMTIPFFLEAWASDFLYESRRVLEGLHRLIRQVKRNAGNHIVDSIRRNWYRLVANRAENPSVLEVYPWHLQKISLGLMVLLESPSDESLRYLAYTCSRPTLKSETNAYHEDLSRAIVEAVQKIRKSIPMQRYLTFLFQSIGISRHVKVALRLESAIAERELNSGTKSVFETVFFEADSQLSRVAKALVEPGSMRVLKMIAPQLSSWQQTKVDEGASSTDFLLKMRASHIILAYFFLQQWSAQKTEGSGQQVISALTEGGISMEVLSRSIFTFVRCVACNKEAMDFRVPLTSPIIGIISSEANVLVEVMSKMNDLLGEPGLPKSEQNNLLSIMKDWMVDPRLKNSLASLSSPSKEMVEKLLRMGRQ